ncbi:MAG: hypothetical protein GXY83_07805 [Rhodopirellula sp.]|nr:hypothetical protein [Rhodopirellula sp.]
MGQLQFGRENRPRNYLGRGEQWRLLLIVLALGLVVILYVQSQNPDNFQWFDAMAQLQDEAADRPAEPRPLKPTPEQDPAGAFRSPLADETTIRPKDEQAEAFSGIDRGDLEAIRDDTPFRSAEQAAWFRLLKILAETPDAALRKASIGRVMYVQLAQQPAAYRGELVTLLGTVRRAQQVAAPENDYGIESYYQLWLQPQDNPNDPIVVYSLNLPDGFPTGSSISAEIRMTGYFFKRWAYMAQDRLRSAPAVLSRSVDWIKRPAATAVRPRRDDWSIGLVLVISAAIAALVTFYVYSRTKREKRIFAETIDASGLPAIDDR